jgi:xylan 1,4-beta-xylosidase
MVQQLGVPVAWIAAVLTTAGISQAAGQDGHFICDGSVFAPYTANKQYLGCYADPNVSILGDAKISTIAMTPQYCADWCGSQGFGYAGVIFGTYVTELVLIKWLNHCMWTLTPNRVIRQCFCGSTPNYSRATKTDDSACNSKCATDPSSYCGGGYM